MPVRFVKIFRKLKVYSQKKDGNKVHPTFLEEVKSVFRVMVKIQLK